MGGGFTVRSVWDAYSKIDLDSVVVSFDFQMLNAAEFETEAQRTKEVNRFELRSGKWARRVCGVRVVLAANGVISAFHATRAGNRPIDASNHSSLMRRKSGNAHRMPTGSTESRQRSAIKTTRA